MRTKIKGCNQCKSGWHKFHIKRDRMEVAFSGSGKNGFLWVGRIPYNAKNLNQEVAWVTGKVTLQELAGAILNAVDPLE